MYNAYFGLRANPFDVSPDPRFLFLTRQAQEALACLAYAVHSRKGFVLLTGEVGTGKTTLLNKFMDVLRGRHTATAFVFNSNLDAPQLFDYILADFGIPCESGSKSQVLLRLNDWLLQRYRAGETAVLIIDEAQNLSPEVLEEVRMLTNLETSREKLLQIVLCGQPELEHKLNLPQLRQLRQRITLRCKTRPFTSHETAAYIAQRLKMAGSNGHAIFTPDAIDAVYLYSGGIPRLINILCDHSLISAYVDQQKSVARETVDEIAREFELEKSGPPAENKDASNGQGENRALIEALQMLITDRLRRSQEAVKERKA